MKQNDIYEFVLLDHIESILKHVAIMIKTNSTTTASNSKFIEAQKIFMLHYFTLYKLIRNNVPKINRHFVYVVNIILTKYEELIDMSVVIENAVDFVEYSLFLKIQTPN